MPAEFNPHGTVDGKKLVFSTKEKQEELRRDNISTFEDEGFSGFPEDRKAINEGLKLGYIVELALEEMSVEEIAEVTSLKVDFVRRIIVHHSLEDKVPDDDFDDIRPEPAAPWSPKPHPETVGGTGGEYQSSPWSDE